MTALAAVDGFEQPHVSVIMSSPSGAPRRTAGNGMGHGDTEDDRTLAVLSGAVSRTHDTLQVQLTEEAEMVTEDEKVERKSALARLEDYAIGVLYSFIERPADNWRFWVKITVVMFLVTAGPAILISLFFLGRDLGYFE